jgi:hypothetical protein
MGTALYCAGVIESWTHTTQQAVVVRLLRSLMARPPWVQMDAPSAVESTLFLQEDRHRFVLSLINYQQELPNIPVRDLTVRVRLDGRTARGVSLLPDRTAVDYSTTDDSVAFAVAELRDYTMLEIAF